MAHDYVPGTDAKFDEWQDDVNDDVEKNSDKWAIPADAAGRLRVKRARWVAAYAKTNNMHDRTHADIVEKKEARRDYVKELRKFIKSHLAFNEAVTDADRGRMGLTVPTGRRTVPPVPDTAPVVEVDFATRLQHTLRFRDSLAESRAKPAKVHGCEIWSKPGEAPVNADELTFLGVNTRSPRTVEYRGDQRGQTVWYWLRWVNSRGEHGPWSAPVSAIIA